jgi:bla regulator protein BlaR1
MHPSAMEGDMGIVAALLLISLAASANPPAALDLSRHFAPNVSACFVLLDMTTGVESHFNAQRCAQRLSPCSTFKIFNSLAGVQAGVVADENTMFAWDGTPQRYKSWETDHTLKSAVRDSVVWYFQRVAAGVGAQRMQGYLDAVDYGNRDIFAGQTIFWLHPNSLKISADEQVRFLAKLYRDRLPCFDQRTTAIVRKILVLDSGDGWQLSGKTGSGGEDNRLVVNWFVGHLRAIDGHEYVFATNITARDIGDRLTAKNATLAILRELKLIPI